jgi:RNA polymerase sigma factor (sigma-70 family)
MWMRGHHGQAVHVRRELQVRADLPLWRRLRVRDQEVGARLRSKEARPMGRASRSGGDENVDDETREEAAKTPSAAVVETFVAHHRELLRYVERRVGSRAAAEEIVQDAFVRSLEHAGDVRESVLGWLYRVLRNAVIDHQRRQAVSARRLDELAAEMADPEDDEDLARVACRCVTDLAATLKPEYADVLRRVEIDGVAVKDYADAAGISPSNAGVRIFRARKALREQVARACGTCADHGCLDCSCDRAPHA